MPTIAKFSRPNLRIYKTPLICRGTRGGGVRKGMHRFSATAISVWLNSNGTPCTNRAKLLYCMSHLSIVHTVWRGIQLASDHNQLQYYTRPVPTTFFNDMFPPVCPLAHFLWNSNISILPSKSKNYKKFIYLFGWTSVGIRLSNQRNAKILSILKWWRPFT